MTEGRVSVSEIIEKMIVFLKGDRRDINHFVHVWAYAKTIGELEDLDEETQFILETAAVTHDISCPLCRKKYGNLDGKNQEKEGGPLVREFLKDTGMTEQQIDRVAFLVGHHHTLTDIDGTDWQILVEADYIVNAEESRYSEDNIKTFLNKAAATVSGKRLIREVLLPAEMTS